MKKPSKKSVTPTKSVKPTAQDYLAQFDTARDAVLNLRMSSALKKGLVILAIDSKQSLSDMLIEIISPIVAERLAKK
jgi:hypothetical protein